MSSKGTPRRKRAADADSESEASQTRMPRKRQSTKREEHAIPEVPAVDISIDDTIIEAVIELQDVPATEPKKPRKRRSSVKASESIPVPAAAPAPSEPTSTTTITSEISEILPSAFSDVTSTESSSLAKQLSVATPNVKVAVAPVAPEKVKVQSSSRLPLILILCTAIIVLLGSLFYSSPLFLDAPATPDATDLSTLQTEVLDRLETIAALDDTALETLSAQLDTIEAVMQDEELIRDEAKQLLESTAAVAEELETVDLREVGEEQMREDSPPLIQHLEELRVATAEDESAANEAGAGVESALEFAAEVEEKVRAAAELVDELFESSEGDNEAIRELAETLHQVNEAVVDSVVEEQLEFVAEIEAATAAAQEEEEEVGHPEDHSAEEVELVLRQRMVERLEELRQGLTSELAAISVDHAVSVRGGRIIVRDSSISPRTLLTSPSYVSKLNPVELVKHMVGPLKTESDPSIVISHAMPVFGPSAAYLRQCFCFKGQAGNITIGLQKAATLDYFQIFHLALAEATAAYKGSAPRQFSVRGHTAEGSTVDFGSFVFATGADSEELQSFPIDQSVAVPVRAVTFLFESNGGAPYTCVYRLKAIGKVDAVV